MRLCINCASCYVAEALLGFPSLIDMQADLQRAIDGFAKKQRRKEQHRNRLTGQPKSV